MLKNSSFYTCLGSRRIKKSSLVLDALGDLDELTCSLGLVRADCRSVKLKKELIRLQKDLVQIGGFLAEVKNKKKTDWLKKNNYLKKMMTELKNNKRQGFVLPGDDLTSARLHLARAFCRRLERRLISLKKNSLLPLVDYLNSLSSYLFWLANREEKREK